MKAIILDMYGVIAKQTGDDFVPYVQKTFPELTREEIQKPWFQADEGLLTSLDVWRILGFEGDLEQVEKTYLDTIAMNEGFHEFAAEMKKHYKLAIISNDSSRWSRYIREKFEINQYFDVINISGDLKMAKPNPAIFELTMEKLGCQPSECVYVDDRRGNLNAARRLGMKTVLFGSRSEEYDGDVVLNFEELGKLLVSEDIREVNKSYWNTYADLWFGTTALPTLGVNFPTEEELHLFGDVSGIKMLEICCGSGHSLKYNADRGAGELWAVDISQKQIENAKKYLAENGYEAKFICAPMEAELDIPKEYFDYVYSIYGIGWTTDLQGTFDKVASYLKKDGIFIFSWHHTLNYCVAWSCDERREVIENDKLVLHKSYFDESYFKMPVHGSEIVLCNRKISTYINALAKAGFMIEQLVEETDKNTLAAKGDISDKMKKAKMLPLSFCIKARKIS